MLFGEHRTETAMRWQTGNRYGIEDRRGMRMGGMGPVGGGGLAVIAIALIGYFVFGVDPSTFLDAGGRGVVTEQPRGKVGTPQDEAGRFVDTMLSSTTDVWRDLFRKSGGSYEPPASLVLYEQATGTRCGTGQAAMGPFYCPLDRRVYIDLSFFNELASRFGAPGDFARAYVIAHEVGHHVQNQTGAAERVRRAQQAAGSEAEANRYSVALELQADCYAGVWAANAERVSGGRVALEAGDLEEGLQAASAVGDDTLQRQAQGRVVPDSFTHGSSEERRTWLRRGYDSGDPKSCDTFAGLN
jgi:predicted metalloprotease